MPARTRRVSARLPGGILVLVLAGATSALAGCGGSDDANRGPVDPAEVLQTIVLTYDADAANSSVRTVPLEQGKVTNVRVDSDTAGDVAIPALNLSQSVEANGQTLLIFSANDSGKFDVVLRTDAGEAPIATLDVQE